MKKLMHFFARTSLITSIGIGCFGLWIASHAAEKKEPGSDIKLERVLPMSADESLASIEVAPGFRMELVAAEPQVIDPVAMAFDEAGRLFVVEMRDYSEQDKEHLGRIRLLTDDDGDGRYETSKVFVDELSWPTAIACYDGGIFVGDAPHIHYCKDTNGDGVADVSKIIYTGFSRINVQGMLNSFHWGLDHRIYGSASTTGGKVARVVRGTLEDVLRAPADADQEKSPQVTNAPLDLRGRDFAINPKTLEMSATTGGGQHGMSFNRWGDRFVCHNSDHLQAIVFEERYLARNPFQSVVSARRSIASDGPQAEVFRISPVEAWREARTKLRVAGLAPGPIEGGGRASGYFTSATGVTIYEGGLWPNNDQEIALVSDVGSNLIHRKRLVRDGVTYRGERIDQNTEFVRARDIWFRPVQMAIGPEGALYVADMCRETIEHPTSLPAVLKRQLNLATGNRGRIYRIVPADYRYSPPKQLAKATAADLVDALDDANQWRRMTALRLIYERQDASAPALLRAKLADCKRPEGRIAMLYALDSLTALNDADILRSLSDPHPQVRRHAIRLSEPRLKKSAPIREAVLSLIADAEPVVQFQLAFSLGDCGDASATKVLAEILRRSTKNRDIVDAALTSIANDASMVLQLLLADGKWASTPSAEPILTAIVGQIARQRRDQDIWNLVDFLKKSGTNQPSASTAALLKALSRLPADVLDDNSLALASLKAIRTSAAESLVRKARRVLEQGTATSEDRVAAIEDLALDKFENQRELLERLLSPQEPAAIHAAVLATCSQYTSPAVAELILSRWQQFSPSEKLQASDLLLRRGPWALTFVQHLAKAGVPLHTLDPSHVARLQNYPSANVRDTARKLLGQGVSKDRQKVVQEYRDGGVLNGGDAAQGKLVFEKNCASCHEVSGIGHQVGPNLASMINRGTETVLFNVLAPNAEVDPRFMEYVVATTDGQVLTGVVAGETSTAVTLRGADNKTTTILRVDIDDIHSTGKSLMPEGFEKVIDKKSMANLIGFLEQSATAASQGAGK